LPAVGLPKSIHWKEEARSLERYEVGSRVLRRWRQWYPVQRRNTMDSMLGYKNDKYMYFGRFAARLDDVVNFIPARISAYLMIAAAFIGGRQFDGKNAYRIFKRDRFNHASPNSAQTESVCAGALRVQLAGDAVYFGKLVKKKYIGDGLREIEYEDIKRANRLMYITAFLCELLSVAVMSFVLILL